MFPSISANLWFGGTNAKTTPALYDRKKTYAHIRYNIYRINRNVWPDICTRIGLKGDKLMLTLLPPASAPPILFREIDKWSNPNRSRPRIVVWDEVAEYGGQ